MTWDDNPGAEVRRIRREVMLTQGQLAKLAGMTRTEIVRIEQGQATPRKYTVAKLRVILRSRSRDKHDVYKVTLHGRRGRDYLALGQTFGFFTIEKL